MDEETEQGRPVRKLNRHKVQEADAVRPAVHGALPYLGHRPDLKHEKRRQAELVRRARKRG
jgi:hypothetical protein